MLMVRKKQGSADGVRMMTEVDPARLQRLRSVRRWSLILSLGFLPAGFALILLERQLHVSPHLANVVGIALMGPWLIALAAATLSILFLRCPGCGELFFIRWVIGFAVWNWRKRCAHCGLELHPRD